MTIHESELPRSIQMPQLMHYLWCQSPQKSDTVRVNPSFCSSLHLLMAAALVCTQGSKGIPSPLCACHGSSALPAALLGTAPAQPSWPSATCSQLTLFVLAQLFLPKAPPEATWKMRSVNCSVLKISQEKNPQNILPGGWGAVVSVPLALQVEGLGLALVPGNGTRHPIQHWCLFLDDGLGYFSEGGILHQAAEHHDCRGIFRRLRYPGSFSLKIGKKAKEKNSREMQELLMPCCPWWVER